MLAFTLILLTFLANTFPHVSCKAVGSRNGHFNSTIISQLTPGRTYHSSGFVNGSLYPNNTLTGHWSDATFGDLPMPKCYCTILCGDKDNEDLDDNEDPSPEYPDPEKDVNRMFKRLKLGGTRDFHVEIAYPDGGPKERKKIISKSYPNKSDFPRDQQLAITFEATGDCANMGMKAWTLDDAEANGLNDFQVEHILELGTIKAFLTDAVEGHVQSNRNKIPANRATVSRKFIQDILNPRGNLPVPRVCNKDMEEYDVPNNRIFEALGSKTCPEFFLLLPRQPNGLKSRIWQVWQGREGYAEDRIEDWVDAAKNEGNPRDMFEAFRNVVAIFKYLDHPVTKVRTSRQSRLMCIRLRMVQEAWNNPPDTIDADKVYNLREFWVEWIKDLMAMVANRQRSWMEKWIQAARESSDEYHSEPGHANEAAQNYVHERLDDYLHHSQQFNIDTSDWELE